MATTMADVASPLGIGAPQNDQNVNITVDAPGNDNKLWNPPSFEAGNRRSLTFTITGLSAAENTLVEITLSAPSLGVNLHSESAKISGGMVQIPFYGENCDFCSHLGTGPDTCALYTGTLGPSSSSADGVAIKTFNYWVTPVRK